MHPAARARGINVSTITHPLKSSLCSDYGQPHPSECTLFSRFVVQRLGAHHMSS